MPSLLLAHENVRMPDHFPNLDAFRHWAKSGAYPDNGQFAYLAGDLFVDFSMEQAFTHNRVKTRSTTVLDTISTGEDLGYLFSDRMLLSNPAADLSCEPDAIFVSYASLDSGVVRLIEGIREGYVEIEGTPDMVLEVVSTSSVEKDYDTLRELYARARIPEYWLIDARGEELRFEILRLTARGYTLPRRQAGGWMRSNVFGRSFRMTQTTDRRGNPQFTLEVRA
jgi:Uma2 family endonuclease